MNAVPPLTEDASEPEGRRDPLLVGAIVRAFEVVDYLATASKPPTLGEIARECGISFQSAQRITNGLIESGYLDRDQQPKSFRFSLRTLDLQYNYLRTSNLLKDAWPVLMALRERTRMRVSLCVLDGTEIVYLLRLASNPRDFQTLLIGRRRVAALTAGGLAILSALSREERRSIVAASNLTPLTSRSIIDPEAILARLDTFAADGFCIEEQETRSGEISAAVPLAPRSGKATHAIVAAGIMEGQSMESFRRDIVPLLQNAAIELSRV
jgi:DNA-binding IclR family transcriptional regulator